MRVTWVITGQGAGEALVSTADEAASALRVVVHEAYADSLRLMAIRKLVQVIRLEMVTEGAAAVSRGETWETNQGGILVKLSP